LVDSVGVNVHLDYADTVYNDFDGKVLPALRYLGVRHVRSGIEDGECTAERQLSLAKSGIGVTGIVPYVSDSMSTLIGCIRKQSEGLEAIEGPNETDEFEQFEYQGKRFPDGTIAFMRDFYPAMKSDEELRSIPVYQTTLAFPENEVEGSTRATSRAGLLGDLAAYADFGNSHNYFAHGNPPGEIIPVDHLPSVGEITPGKPFVSTEGGYCMGESDGYKGGWDDGLSAPFDEAVPARYLSRYVLEMFRNGYSRSFLYELFDIDDPQWGLFRNDGSPRPAADAIRAMFSLLGEGKWDATAREWQVTAFTPKALSYDLSSAPTSVHSVLTQKSDGRFYLVVWNEVNSWDPEKGQPLDVDAVPAKLTVKMDVQSIRTYVPTDSGTQVKSESKESTIDLDVLDRPVIVEITPG
jgi:hypothetical protein